MIQILVLARHHKPRYSRYLFQEGLSNDLQWTYGYGIRIVSQELIYSVRDIYGYFNIQQLGLGQYSNLWKVARAYFEIEKVKNGLVMPKLYRVLTMMADLPQGNKELQFLVPILFIHCFFLSKIDFPIFFLVHFLLYFDRGGGMSLYS